MSENSSEHKEFKKLTSLLKNYNNKDNSNKDNKDNLNKDNKDIDNQN